MNQKLASLDAMGIDVWVRRASATEEAVVETSNVAEPSYKQPLSVEPELVSENIDKQKVLLESQPVLDSEVKPESFSEVIAPISSINEAVIAPEVVVSEKASRQIVWGLGAANADCLVIGDPTVSEANEQNELFSIREDQLLTLMLKAIGLNREQVFVGSLVENQPEQSNVSNQRLDIEMMKPKVILCLGHVAAQSLLNVDSSIEEMRGITHFYDVSAIPAIVTFHPGYLLNSPAEKGKSWQDLLLAQSLLEKDEHCE